MSENDSPDEVEKLKTIMTVLLGQNCDMIHRKRLREVLEGERELNESEKEILDEFCKEEGILVRFKEDNLF